jgi:hypothetical protein
MYTPRANVIKPPQNYDYGMRDFDVFHVVATTSEQSSSKIDLHRGNGIPRPRDKRPKIAFRPETVFAETKAQTQKPAHCGLLGRLREICRFERLRGGPGRIRTSKQTVMSGGIGAE